MLVPLPGGWDCGEAPSPNVVRLSETCQDHPGGCPLPVWGFALDRRACRAWLMLWNVALATASERAGVDIQHCCGGVCGGCYGPTVSQTIEMPPRF